MSKKNGLCLTIALVMMASSCDKITNQESENYHERMLGNLSEEQSKYIGKNVFLLRGHVKDNESIGEINIYYTDELSNNLLVPRQIIIYAGMEYLINKDSIIIDVRFFGTTPYRSQGAELEKYILGGGVKEGGQ